MARLTAATRNALPSSKFGLPGSRAYPMPDRKHAQVAKAYAERYASPGEKAKIDAKANRILGENHGRPHGQRPSSHGHHLRNAMEKLAK